MKNSTPLVLAYNQAQSVIAKSDKNQLKELNTIIEAYPQLINFKTSEIKELENKYQLLFLVCSSEATLPEKIKLIQLLCQKGANLNFFDNKFDSSYLMASNSFELFTYLVDCGAKLKNAEIKYLKQMLDYNSPYTQDLKLAQKLDYYQSHQEKKKLEKSLNNIQKDPKKLKV